MWLNQVANNLPDDPEAVDVLVRAFQTPSSAEEAQARFAEVESVTRDLASKGQPAVGRIPYVLSVFWSTDEDDPGWPVHWKSAPDRMLDLGWVSSWSSADRYAALLDVSRTYYPSDRHRLERVLWFLTKHRFVGLNPTLPDMCAEAAELLAQHESGRGYPTEADETRAASLAAQLKGELQLAMVGLLDEVRETTGLDLEKSNLQLRTAFDKSSPYRADAYATWTLPGGMSSPGYRLWATKSGLALGVYGGWGGGSQADYDDIATAMTAALPDGYQFFKVSQHRSGDRLAPVGSYAGGEVFAGAWWDWSSVNDGLALKDELLAHVERLTPVIRAVMGRGGAEIVDGVEPPSGELQAALAQFKAERPYPNDKDPWQEEQRAIFAEALSAENLAVFDLDIFRKLVNGRSYGHPGPMPGLQRRSQCHGPRRDRLPHRKAAGDPVGRGRPR